MVVHGLYGAFDPQRLHGLGGGGKLASIFLTAVNCGDGSPCAIAVPAMRATCVQLIE